jgi:hypothetical protein
MVDENTWVSSVEGVFDLYLVANRKIETPKKGDVEE